MICRKCGGPAVAGGNYGACQSAQGMICVDLQVKRPKLLDLFCGGGGAGFGYMQAGFDVTGVDLREQPGYPSIYYQADALEYLAAHGSEFDAIHASPPCQGYSHATYAADSVWVHHSRGINEPMLIEPVRELLISSGKPYIIENVMGARDHLRQPILLCGSMFGAHPNRHRLFETSFSIEQSEHPKCIGRDKAYAEANGIDYRDMSVTGKSRRAGSIDLWRRLMGMPYAARGFDLTEAIPPRYSKLLGERLRYATGL